MGSPELTVKAACVPQNHRHKDERHGDSKTPSEFTKLLFCLFLDPEARRNF